MRNILWGVLIISIGLWRRDSVFFGDFGAFNVVFDGLGLFWIGKGVLGLVRSREGAAA